MENYKEYFSDMEDKLKNNISDFEKRFILLKELYTECCKYLKKAYTNFKKYNTNIEISIDKDNYVWEGIKDFPANQELKDMLEELYEYENNSLDIYLYKFKKAKYTFLNKNDDRGLQDPR